MLADELDFINEEESSPVAYSMIDVIRQLSNEIIELRKELKELKEEVSLMSILGLNIDKNKFTITYGDTALPTRVNVINPFTNYIDEDVTGTIPFIRQVESRYLTTELTSSNNWYVV